jgi:hypothetical protein
MRRNVILLVVLATATVAVVQAAKFTSVWKAPDISTIGFAGKKIAALVITTDDGLRQSAEEALVRQLEAIGVQGEASYRLAPSEVLKDKDKAKAWFEKVHVEGVVAMRLVSADKVTTYTPATFSTGYYGSLWGYYGYSWGVAWSPGYSSEDTKVIVETLLFSVPLDKLLWAGVSETTNPKNTDVFMKDLVEKAVKEMKKQGLTAPPKKK